MLSLAVLNDRGGSCVVVVVAQVEVIVVVTVIFLSFLIEFVEGE